MKKVSPLYAGGKNEMSRGGGRGRENSSLNRGSKTGRHLDKAARDNRSRQLNPGDSTFHDSRRGSSNSGGWRERMDRIDASRIQSHADKTGKNQDFKERAQRAASKNEDEKQQ